MIQPNLRSEQSEQSEHPSICYDYTIVDTRNEGWGDIDMMRGLEKVEIGYHRTG